jgi:uncharacterized protein YbaP (TraB family)
MIWKKWFGRIAAGFAAIGLMGTAAAREAPRSHVAAEAVARPGLWRLRDKDTTIYLFGTIHALPADMKWRTPAFDAAFRSADQLMIEIGNIDDTQAVGAELMKAGIAQGLPPLLERVPEAKRPALKAAMAKSGYPTALFNEMKSWMAAVLLLNVTMKEIGLDAEKGAERPLVAEWKAKGGKVEGFETAAEQFGFLNGLSLQGQAKFLEAAADSPEAARKEFAAMLKAWRTGDVAGIAHSFDDETNMSAELRDVLMKKRNARWAQWLAARMAKPGTVFVAVGAGHLAGPDSVIALLARRGLKAVRVQ